MNPTISLIILILLIGCKLDSLGQDLHGVDSIIAQTHFKRAKDLHSNWKYDSALQYYNRAINIYRTKDLWHEVLKCRVGAIASLERMQKHDSLMILALESIKIAKFKNYAKELSTIHFYIGVTQFRLNSVQESISHYKKSIQMSKGIAPQDSFRIAGSFHAIGRIYSTNEDFEQALQYINESLKWLNPKKNRHKYWLALNYNTAGIIHSSTCSFNTALEYFKSIMNMGDKDYVGESYANAAYHMALTYYWMGNLTEAEYYTLKSIELYNQREYSNQNISFPLLLLGAIYMDRGQFDKALKEYEAALKVNSQNA